MFVAPIAELIQNAAIRFPDPLSCRSLLILCSSSYRIWYLKFQIRLRFSQDARQTDVHHTKPTNSKILLSNSNIDRTTITNEEKHLAHHAHCPCSRTPRTFNRSTRLPHHTLPGACPCTLVVSRHSRLPTSLLLALAFSKTLPLASQSTDDKTTRREIRPRTGVGSMTCVPSICCIDAPDSHPRDKQNPAG